MNKALWLKVLNPWLFLSTLMQAVTGVMLFFSLFPRSSEIARAIHNYNGLVFIALALGHLALNWTWVKVTFFNRKK